MNTANIKKINVAVAVLKHFVELSAQLLPYLKDLKGKESISLDEIKEIEKIKNVYTAYNVDENTSILLLDSNIIGLIKSSFKAINHQNKKDDFAVKYYMGRFNKEYSRLRENWKIQELN